MNSASSGSASMMYFTAFSTALVRLPSSSSTASRRTSTGSHEGLPSLSHFSSMTLSATRRALSRCHVSGRASDHCGCLGHSAGGCGVMPPVRPYHIFCPTPSHSFTLTVLVEGLRALCPVLPPLRCGVVAGRVASSAALTASRTGFVTAFFMSSVPFFLILLSMPCAGASAAPRKRHNADSSNKRLVFIR